ncbi:MAG: hypothetical protein HKO93_03850, partial [Flavobacteriales bacterium]|nr:hypothetical protein [Flavobacteriales bacterium]
MERLLPFYLLIAIFCLPFKAVKAQQSIYEEPTVIFTKSLQGGVHVHPRGWGVNFAYGDIRTVDKTILYGVEILGMKHSKEVKQFNAFYEDAKG